MNKEKIYTKDLSNKELHENFCFVSDFDGTITNFDSSSSIGIFRNLFDKQYSLELNSEMNRLIADKEMPSNEKTKAYAIFELKTLSNYLKQGIDYDEILKKIQLRHDFYNFMDMINKDNKKLFISSSGIGNIIEFVLSKKNIDISNITITANFFDSNYEFDYDNVIFSKKKYAISVLDEISKFDSKILIGNEISDINMLPSSEKNYKNVYIGLLKDSQKIMQYLNNFDIISLDDRFCVPVHKALNIKNKKRR